MAYKTSGKYHPFHLVQPSPWPVLISIAALNTMFGAALYMHFYKGGLLALCWGLFNVILVMSLWWRDVIREATFEGRHTLRVQRGLRIGFILFIVSEVMFFFGFFWAFFYSSLAPAIQIGAVWPPFLIVPFNPLNIPLVNTVLLLQSGLTVTYTHHALVKGQYFRVIQGFTETIIWGLLFTQLQFHEYRYAPFAISDGIYGSVFYMITGLHGCHVIIGTLFLMVCFARTMRGHFTRTHHLGFEFSVWYWHFVDVVWLFVYIFVYWWGGYESDVTWFDDCKNEFPRAYQKVKAIFH
jgi:cytochrome c oxidase subunit 3